MPTDDDLKEFGLDGAERCEVAHSVSAKTVLVWDSLHKVQGDADRAAWEEVLGAPLPPSAQGSAATDWRYLTAKEIEELARER